MVSEVSDHLRFVAVAALVLEGPRLRAVDLEAVPGIEPLGGPIAPGHGEQDLLEFASADLGRNCLDQGGAEAQAAVRLADLHAPEIALVRELGRRMTARRGDARQGIIGEAAEDRAHLDRLLEAGERSGRFLFEGHAEGMRVQLQHFQPEPVKALAIAHRQSSDHARPTTPPSISRLDLIPVSL